jgi:hypothetical protein
MIREEQRPVMGADKDKRCLLSGWYVSHYQNSIVLLISKVLYCILDVIITSLNNICSNYNSRKLFILNRL